MMTESCEPCPVTIPAGGRTETSGSGQQPANSPCHRSIVALDVAGSTTRTDVAKIQLRQDIYDLFEAALAAAGITDEYRDPLIDRGDGILALIHPRDQVPKTLLLSTVTPALRSLLTAHQARHPGRRLQVRAVVHAGEVCYDRRGCFGEALDIAFRLLDAPEVRQQPRDTGAPLTLVISDTIYHSIVRHGHLAADHAQFESTAEVWIAGHRHTGWVQRPADSAPLRTPREPGRRRVLDVVAG